MGINMIKIYSKVSDNLLLHLINKKENIQSERTELSDINEVLQVCTLILPKGKTFRPHMHIENIRTTNITQEMWVVIKGKVRVYHYDLDTSLISIHDLCEGDCTITFYGGHTYEILEENTIVYEIKNGPYLGQINDKIFIDNKGETK